MWRAPWWRSCWSARQDGSVYPQKRCSHSGHRCAAGCCQLQGLHEGLRSVPVGVYAYSDHGPERVRRLAAFISSQVLYAILAMTGVLAP